jgi:hypothetical protein
MKNIKEKQLLVNFAKAFGQDVDESISREVNAINEVKLNAIKSIRENSFQVLSEAFKKAKEEEKKIDKVEYPLPPSLDDVMSLIEETDKEIQQTQERDIQKEAVDFISKSIKEDSFQQPVAPIASPDITSIQKKIQFLEQWVSKISMAGPGSGEVKFKYLDDLEKNSIGDTDQILRYRPSAIGDRYGTFFFGQLSGNQGPIQSMLYNPTQDLYSGNVTRQAGLTYYDSREDTLEIIHGDGAATYTGQDNYIRVYNNYGANLTKGTFVQFSGAIEDVVTCVPYVNGPEAQGLYSVGVLATDVQANTIGRAKLLGEIRNIDTTGSSIGETWQLGDLLWADSSTPGKLTKSKPSPPNVVISVAAVLKANATSGIILVRPSIWPRLHYGTFTRANTQIAPNVNYGHAIKFSDTDSLSGLSLSGNTRIVANYSGRYQFDITIQYASKNSSTSYLWSWIRVNGQDVPISTYKVTAESNKAESTLSYTLLRTMNAQEYLEVIFAVSSTSMFLSGPPGEIFCPAIPSVVVNVAEIAL